MPGSSEARNHRGVQVRTVVRGFEVEAFEQWESWGRLQRLLDSGHGAYGISGPRGAGKTWLMRRAEHLAAESDSIGLWFPSPSEYDSIAFLAALTERFAEAVEERRQEQVPIVGFATMGSGFVVFGGLVFGVVGAVYGGLLFNTPFAILLGAIVGIASGVLYLGFLRLLRASRPWGRALLYARDLRQRVRFAMTRREGIDLAASLGSGVKGSLGMSRQRELAERPVTLSSLVHDFRRLATLTAKATDSPVVISIDELDKIDDEEKVRELLRDIKGIFGVPNVHFLVSVSHEAARSLNLNGIVDRNEFNSSFDVVLELDRIGVASMTKLLISRGWPSGRSIAANAIAVLSGGIPREAVRLAEKVIGDSDLAVGGLGGHSNEEIVSAAIAPEARELRRVVVTSGPNESGARVAQLSRIHTFTTLSDELLSAAGLRQQGTEFVEAVWEPTWADDAPWRDRFLEEWRRLLVRIYVATLLIRETHVDPDALQRVIQISSQSATVAILSLFEAAEIKDSKTAFVTEAMGVS